MKKLVSFWKQVKEKSSDMFTLFRVGIGVKVPTHKFHVKDKLDPIKIEGLQNDTTDPDKFLTIDASNVVKYRTGAEVISDIAAMPLNPSSILVTDLIIGEDAETCIDFGTADEIDFKINNVTEISLNANYLSPTSNDGIGLGSPTKSWANLYLATGASIGWGDGDAILSHSSNTLSFGINGNGSDMYIFGDTSSSALKWTSSSNNLAALGSASITATTSASATILTTARAINGEDFDGSADITVTAAGSTLSDTVPVSKGGTGATSLTSNSLLTGNGASAIQAETQLSFASNRLTIGPTNTTVIGIKRQDGAGVGGTLKLEGANGTGTDQQGGSLKFYGGQGTGTGDGGDIEFWTAADGTSGSSLNGFGVLPRLKVDADGDTTISGNLNILGTIFTTGDATVFGNDIIFEGTSDDVHEATLSGGNPGSDITVTLPASTGTLALQNEDTTGTAATVTSGTQAAITTCANLTTVGTIGTGTWNADVIASAKLDADTAHLTTDQTFTGAKQINKRKFTQTSSTHFEAQGDILYYGLGSTTQGDLCYLKEDASWGQADADGAATGDDEDRDATGMLAIALGTDPDVDGMLLRGVITMDYDLGDVGNPIYIKLVAGSMSNTAPTASGDFVRVVGYCLNDTNGQMWFNPDTTWVEIA